MVDTLRTEREVDEPDRLDHANFDAFFQTVRFGCLLFLGLLLSTTLATAAIFIQRLSQPPQVATGNIAELVENPGAGNRTMYGLTLESEEGERLFLRLRNHGRVLNYLRTSTNTEMVTIQYRDGELFSLTPAGASRPVREREAPVLILGIASLLSFLVFLLLALPWLPFARSGSQPADSPVAAHEEE